MDFVSLTCAHSPQLSHTLDPGVEYRYIGMLTDYIKYYCCVYYVHLHMFSVVLLLLFVWFGFFFLYSRLFLLQSLSIFHFSIANSYHLIGRSVGRLVDFNIFFFVLTCNVQSKNINSIYALPIIFSFCLICIACVALFMFCSFGKSTPMCEYVTLFWIAPIPNQCGVCVLVRHFYSTRQFVFCHLHWHPSGQKNERDTSTCRARSICSIIHHI